MKIKILNWFFKGTRREMRRSALLWRKTGESTWLLWAQWWRATGRMVWFATAIARCGSLVLLALAAAALEPKRVTLLWDYPPEEMNGITFVIRHSEDAGLPLEEWPVFGVTTATNLQFDLMPGRHFFTVQASNFWGVSSDFSTVCATPAVASPVQRVAILRP